MGAYIQLSSTCPPAPLTQLARSDIDPPAVRLASPTTLMVDIVGTRGQGGIYRGPLTPGPLDHSASFILLLSTYYMHSPMPGIGNTAMNKAEKNPCPHRADI